MTLVLDSQDCGANSTSLAMLLKGLTLGRHKEKAEYMLAIICYSVFFYVVINYFISFLHTLLPHGLL